jgi:LDH2 family malate/lactate/ureidoglycolate dehydrogenase
MCATREILAVATRSHGLEALEARAAGIFGIPVMNRYSPLPLKQVAARIVTAVGVSSDDAALLADALVEADVSGTSTHGVSRLAIYVKRIEKGLIDPKAPLHIERQRASTLAVDAGNGLGQVQAVRTLDLLIPMARQAGVATATVRRSQHFGAASYYCNRAAEQGMILLATTNCEPSMSPEGGCEAFFGTNPIAMSFPTGKGFHVKTDLATSLVARGNIIAAQKRGERIPPGWALDVDGNPTTDASAALAGTVLTMAGHKGYALALMVEVLSGVLSGAAVGSEIGSMYKNLDRAQDVGHFFCLLDIAAFMDLDEFKSRIDAMIDGIKSCRRRPGVEEILVPGERSHRTASDRRQHGVPLDGATVAELRELSTRFGVPFRLDPVVVG